jgi:hypothetical protein
MMGPVMTKKTTNDEQITRFKQAARTAECDEDEAHFEKRLRTVATAAPPPKTIPKPAKKKPGK